MDVIKTSRYRVEYFKGKKERRERNLGKEAEKEGVGKLSGFDCLTIREQEMLKRYILTKYDAGFSSDEEPDPSKPVTIEDHIDSM